MFMDLLGNLDMLHHWRDFLDGLFPNTDWSGIRHPVLRLRASVVPTLHFGTAFKRGPPKANARCCLMSMRGGWVRRQCVRAGSGVWVAAGFVAAPAALVASVAVASAALSAEAADAAQAIICSCAAEHVQVPCGC